MTKPKIDKNARWIFITLIGINLLNYIDRYIFSALLPNIKEDLQLSDAQLGSLGSAFIFAYILVAPILGWLGDRFKRTNLMAYGVVLWSVATAMTGSAHTFLSQFVTRIAVGVGESAYSVISPSVIADIFRRQNRGVMFALYSAAIPVGSALGYIIGGHLGELVGWQKAFYVVGGPGVLLALLLFFMKDPARGNTEDFVSDNKSGESGSQKTGVVTDYMELVRNGTFMSTVLGYAAYTFVVGGMAFWMPTFIVRYFDVSLAKGNTVFGGITVAGGFIGTLFGGWWADRWERRSGNGYLKVSVASVALSVPILMVALRQTDFNSFIGILFFGEVALFLCMSPLDTAVINAVPISLRATAMAFNVFLIHALGDGISRALIGQASDEMGLRSAIAFIPWVLGLAGVIWLAGVILSSQVLPWPTRALRLPRWQSHRGFWKSGIQENTLDAFRASRAHGFEMVELDVLLSKNSVPVVFHDVNLLRLRGREVAVSSLTDSELKSQANAPTLEEVLGDSQAPKYLNIEIKAHDRNLRILGAAIAKVIQKCHAEDRVLISSFDPFVLRSISKLLPEVPRALLIAADQAFVHRNLLTVWIARAHLLHLQDELLTPKMMARLKRRNVPVAAWTVNNLERANALFSQGAVSIITDENLV